jgi:hypothetical protein
LLATLLVMSAGIAYRVLEIPEQPNGEDDLAYVAGLPRVEDNHGGREFKIAAERFNRRAQTGLERQEPMTAMTTVGPRREPIDLKIEQVLRDGWSDVAVRDREELISWIDKMFANSPVGPEEPPWHVVATNAATMPIGLFEDPKLLGITSPPTMAMDSAKRMGLALIVRGLQLQALDPDDFPRRFQVAMVLAQTLRKGSVVASFAFGADVERAALLGLDRWLDRLPVTSDRIRAVLDTLLAAEPAEPFDPAPHLLAERYVLREGMKSPAQWLPQLLTGPGSSPDATATEVDLVSVAWAVPWERERTRRIVGLGFESGLPTSHAIVQGRPGLGFLIGRVRTPRDLMDHDRLLTTHRRASILKVALRAYRAAEGRYPDSLSDLVQAGYLSRLPADPFDETRTYGYRLTNFRPTLKLGPGAPKTITDDPPDPTKGPIQAIIWRVGSDKIDQKGLNQPGAMALGQARQVDLVYPVPVGLDPRRPPN